MRAGRTGEGKRKKILAGLGTALAALAGATLLVAAVKEDPGKGNAETVKRGAYLVALGGCNDCHTPFRMGPRGPEPDMSRQLSGHPEAVKLVAPPKLDGGWMWAGAATNTAFAGPWGVTYAINLTPDPETGLGAWTEQNFVQAMRTGKHLGVSRPILPPMPWQNLGRMTDADLHAVFVYLHSIKPIRNKVPAAQIAAGPAGG